MEATIDQKLLADAEQYVRSFFETHISPDYVFHNFPHSESVAESVRESGDARALEPMTSADRKVIHDALNDEDGVSSRSEGDDPNRRIVVVPD